MLENDFMYRGFMSRCIGISPHFRRDCNNVRQGRVHSPYWIQQRTGILLVGRLLQVVIIVISSPNMQRTFVSGRFMRCNLGVRLKNVPFYSKIFAVFVFHTILCQNNIFFVNNPTWFIFMTIAFHWKSFARSIYFNFLFSIYNSFFSKTISRNTLSNNEPNRIS